MSRARSANGRAERCVGLQGLAGNLNRIGHLKNWRRWEGNVDIECEDIEWGRGVDWIHLPYYKDQ